MSIDSNFRGAVLKTQGVTFAVVIVNAEVIGGPSGRIEEVRDAFSVLFPGMPVVLMSLDLRGRPTYHGRRDIARFMSTVRVEAITWIDYTVSEPDLPKYSV